MTWPGDLSFQSLYSNSPIHVGVDHAAFWGGPSYQYAACVATFDGKHEARAFSPNDSHALAAALTQAIEAGWLPESVNIEKTRLWIEKLKSHESYEPSRYSRRDAGADEK